MSLYAFDAANPGIDIAAMVRHGAIVAPVYIVGNPGGFPHVSKARVAALRKAGLAPLPNWERAADFFRHCTIAEGRAAGVEALVACRDLGFPDDGSIDVAFSFDYGIDPADYDAATARLVAANQGLGGHYRAIAYGPIGFLGYLAEHGQPGPHWLMASTFRATSQFHADEVGAPHVALVQSHTAAGNWLSSPIPSTDINTVVNPHALGAWWPDGSPYAGTEFTMDAEAKARFDKIDAAVAKVPQLTLSLDGVPVNLDPANPNWAVSSALGFLVRHVSALDPAKLAAAIAAALPSGSGASAADLEAAVRKVFADAGTP